MTPRAVLHHFDTFCIVFLVFVCTIIAALAFWTCKSNSFTHSLHLTQLSLAHGHCNMLIEYIISPYCSQQIPLKKAGASQQNDYITLLFILQLNFIFYFITVSFVFDRLFYFIMPFPFFRFRQNKEAVTDRFRFLLQLFYCICLAVFAQIILLSLLRRLRLLFFRLHGLRISGLLPSQSG